MTGRLGSLALFCALAALPCPAQNADGMPAGGKWMRTEEIDSPSGAKVIKFTLTATEAEMGRAPYLELVCTGDGKLLRGRYFADTVISPNAKNYLDYNQPSISPKVRFDKRSTFSPLWEMCVDKKSAILDRRTLHELLKSSELHVRYLDKSTAHLEDVYVVDGLNPGAVQRACGNNGWFDK